MCCNSYCAWYCNETVTDGKIQTIGRYKLHRTKGRENFGTFLQLENTGEQDLAPVAPKQKKKPKCPPESDKNQKDIRSYFAATPRQATKKPETKKPKSPNVITID